MTIERKRVLSSIILNFATEDLKDTNGKILLAAGAPKEAQVQYAEYLVEDGVVIESTRTRIDARVADIDALPELKSKVMDAVVRITADRNDLRTARAAARAERDEARAQIAELRTQLDQVRSEREDAKAEILQLRAKGKS